MFSVLKVKTSGHQAVDGAKHGGAGRYGVKANLALCKFDAIVVLLECRKHKEYRSGCNKRYCPHAKMNPNGDTCSNSASDRLAWGKGYQCKPNKASCEGGAMVKRQIALKLDPKHPKSSSQECKRLLLPLDALLRCVIGPIAALNLERSQRTACGGQ